MSVSYSCYATPQLTTMFPPGEPTLIQEIIPAANFSFLLRGATFFFQMTRSRSVIRCRPLAPNDHNHSRAPHGRERQERGGIYWPRRTQSCIQVFATFQVVV